MTGKTYVQRNSAKEWSEGTPSVQRCVSGGAGANLGRSCEDPDLGCNIGVLYQHGDAKAAWVHHL